jgi:YegS/Rv2252/BmrU family lipid kinase
MKNWAIIYNPTSGSFRPERLEALERTLHEHGVRARLHPTEHAGHAMELGRAVNGIEQVLSYGGDGTLNEVANGLLGRGLPLMFVPGGTANAMAYELGIPRDPSHAVRAMVGGRTIALRPGRVGSRAFMLMAGFGFDATAVYMVTDRLKGRLGALAYIWTGVGALFRAKPELRVKTPEGVEHRGVWVVGARARRYGGMFSVHPRAGLQRPGLGMVVVSKAMIAPFALTNLAFGTGFTGPGMRLEEHAGFRVRCEEPFHAHVDGDYLGQDTAFEIGLSQETLPFCIPPER